MKSLAYDIFHEDRRVIWRYIQRVMRDRDEIQDKIARLRDKDLEMADLQRRAVEAYKAAGGVWR